MCKCTLTLRTPFCGNGDCVAPQQSGHRSSSEPTQINALIAELPLPSQRRVAVIAQTLRDLINSDTSGEAELAFTLVLAERTNDE